MNYSITRHGEELDKSLYFIDEANKIFSSTVNDLVLDFAGQNGWSFETRSNCKFITGSHCNFGTDWDCIFKTGSYCTFTTDWGCNFTTGPYCTFTTLWGCIFKTGSRCAFEVGCECIFKTGQDCTFNLEDVCTILSWNGDRFLPFIINDKGTYEIEEGKLIKK